MNRSARKGAGGALWLMAAAVLGLSVAFGGTANALPQYSLSCIDCHTMPPTDSTTGKKDPTNGAIPGNHTKHASSDKNSCVVCHGNGVLTYATGHRNGIIELSDGLSYSRKQAGVFLNQTSVPPNPLGSCSTAACHSDGKGNFKGSPSWGGAALQAPGDCATCHGVAPASGSHPVSGSKHAAYFGTGTGACVKCHSDHANESNAFAHATSAGKRGIDVHFAGGGSFAANQCSNLYCHSNGRGSYSPPTWGGTLDCSGCHGTATSDTLSGKHSKHVNNQAFLGTNFGCANCHSATVSDNTTIRDVTKHVNGVKDVPVACSSCHNDGRSLDKSTALDWNGSQTLDCTGCHGSDTNPGATAVNAGAPNYANAGINNAHANTHAKHVTNGINDCQNCHSATMDGTVLKAGGSHLDGTIQAVAGNGKSFTINNKTCSNISCHSGNGIVQNVPAAQWGDSLGCNGCHGDAASLATNAHSKHVQTMGYGCVTCHNQTAASNTSLVPGNTTHMNGAINVVGSGVTFDSNNITCTTACHGSATPKWTDATTAQCGSCHQALSGTANGLVASGSHSTHFGSAYGPKLDGSTANSCAICHVYNGDTVAPHDNGSVDIKTPAYNKTGTCGSCHYTSVTWGNTGRLSCSDCHVKSGSNNNTLSAINGVTAPDKSQAATLGHGQAGIDQTCTACHDNSSAHIGVSGGTKRLNSALIGAAGSNQECVYCHNDASKVTDSAKQITMGHYSFANTCNACHDPHGTGNANMVMKNFSTAAGRNSNVVYSGTTSFITADGYGICQVCHTQTIYFKRGVPVDGSSHQPVGTNCLDCHKHNPGANQTAFQANGACNGCHGYPPMPRNAAITFGVHGQYSSARFEDYSGGGGAHATLAHLDPNVTPDMGFAPCLKCHNGADSTHTKALPVKSHIENVKVIVDPKYRFSADVQFMGYTEQKLISGANQTGSCFNVSCHFKKTKPWSSEK